MKLAPGWALIHVNFDFIQEIGPKVGGEHSFEGGHSFEDGCSFANLRYTDCMDNAIGGLGTTCIISYSIYTKNIHADITLSNKLTLAYHSSIL